MWHYFQALKTLEQERTQKEDEQKLMILLIRPELYKAMYEKNGDEIVENTNFVETKDEEGNVMSTLTPEDFKKLVKQKEEEKGEQVLVSKTHEGEIIQVNNISDYDYPMSVTKI